MWTTYYLLHILNTKFYNGLDGKGGVVKTCRLFEHAQQWIAEGKIKHLGFSFHDSPEVLDQILTEHPEVEFVQIIINYFDWNSYFIASKGCYDVIRKHGKKIVVMEPVKGGVLAQIPLEKYSIEAIRAAYDHGCTFFDTAEVYSPNLAGIGHNERIVGKALKDVRENAVIATKLMLSGFGFGSVYHTIRKHLEGSLDRLQTEYVDIYYLHRMSGVPKPGSFHTVWRITSVLFRFLPSQAASFPERSRRRHSSKETMMFETGCRSFPEETLREISRSWRC